MAVETVTEARRVLAGEGLVEDLVADGQQLRVVSSGRTYAPAELAVARVIRLRGITTPEEEAVLFGLATGDGRSLGAYVPPYRPAIPAEDEAIAAELHQKVSPEDKVPSHGSHDHVAAVFATRDAARAVVDELREQGLGTDRMGMAVREGAPRVFEREADAEVLHDAATGTAAGAAIGFLAGMAISAIVFIPGGIIGLGGILALGAGSTLGGAMVGGYIGQDTADRAFDERQELEEIHLDPGQVLVVVCSHGRPADVEEIMERHGGDLVHRARRPSTPARDAREIALREDEGMERVVRTLRVDGHEVAIIESMEEEGSGFLLVVDDETINPDAPLAVPPSDREVCAAVARWAQGR